MMTKSDTPRNVRRRVRRRVERCREAAEWLHDEAMAEPDPVEAAELLTLSTETMSVADAAEQLLTGW